MASERMRRFFSNWVYPDVAVVVFCIFLLIGVWGAAFWQMNLDKQVTIANIIKDGEQFNYALEEHVRRVLDTGSLYLNFIKKEYETAQVVTPAILHFGELIGQDPMINLFALVDADGRTVTSLIPYPENFNSAQTPYFEAHVAADNNKVFIGQPFVGRVSHKISIPLSVRLNNTDGSFAGIVYIALNPNYFSDFYQSIESSGYYDITIIGQDKIVRAGSVSSLIGSEMAQNSLFSESAKTPIGSYNLASGSERMWQSYRVMPDYPLIIQVGIKESVLQPLYKRQQTALGAASVVSLFIIIYTGRLVLRNHRLRQSETELKESYQTLKETHNKLSLAEEELRAQYEELLQINKQVLEQNALLYALQETAVSMISELNTDDLLKKIALHAITIVGADEAYLARPTEDGHLEVYSGIGGPPRMPENMGLLGKVYVSGQAMVVNDYQQWEGRIREEYAQKISAFFAAPIKGKQKVIGVFGVVFFERGRQFNENQVVLLERFADLVSLAMQNSLLHASQQQELAARINSETTLNEIFNGANDAIVVTDLDKGSVLWANKHASEMFGYSEDEVILQGLEAIVSVQEVDLVKTILNKVAGGQPQLFEGKAVDRAGKQIIVEVSAKQAVVHGQMCCLTVMRDITARKQLESELVLAQTAKLAVLDSIPDAMFVLDYNGMVLEYLKSPDFETYSVLDQAIRGHHLSELIPKDIACNYVFNVRQALATGTTQYYEYSVAIDGTVYFRETRFKKIGQSKVLTMVRDITDARRSKDQLDYLSQYDALTNIYNRAYFEATMSKMAMQSEGGVAIVICDVDGLKIINDTLGHWAGDQLLRAVANILGAVTVFADDVLARVGGDEFAIIAREPQKQKMDAMIENIQLRIAEYNKDNPQLPVSLSTGWAADYHSSKNIEEIYKQADHDMYRQKIHQGQSSRSAIVQTMMKALEVRDYITEGHTDRLQDLVGDLGRKLKLSRRQLADLRLFARFHDIGKVGIPDSILTKPTLLNEAERAIMKRHCEIGFRIAQVSLDLSPIADWILKHQEWWNGQGYPLGISGEDIPLACRILAIADTFDAMTNDRPYRKALSPSVALAEIERYAGSQFDPALVKLFIEIMHEREATA